MTKREIMGSLIWDWDKGYAYIEMTHDFKTADVVVCLDALSDWATGLRCEYAEHYKRGQREFEKKTSVQKIRLETAQAANKRVRKKA